MTTFLRWLASVYLAKLNIGWVFGGLAALTAFVWTDFGGWWQFVIVLGFACVAGLVSGLIGRNT